jgi:Flp pilus assembly protein TadD
MASLEAFMAEVRRASAAARPRPAALQTIEASDPSLAAALARALASPSPEAYRAVAHEYKRLRVFDRAHQYLDQALAMDAADAATYDARARLWRDAGFADLGLSDAYRAVYYAPDSAPARNTLGTILQVLGHRGPARDEYARAARLDRTAAYALNNLCYTWVLDGEATKAIAACSQALAVQPTMAAARNNLGLAQAVAGRTLDAERTFAAAGDPAAARYNTGMVRLARGQYKSAVEAFQEAHALRPTLKTALARVQQAEAAAAAHAEE